MKARGHSMHDLVLGGDSACAHGDAGALCDVVRELAIVAPPSFHRELIALGNVANTPGGNPFAGWASLRSALVETLHDDADDDHAGKRAFVEKTQRS